MKAVRKMIILLCSIIAALALAACGQEEEEQERYVYVPEALAWNPSAETPSSGPWSRVSNLQISGEYLYFFYSADSGDSIKRIRLEDMDWSKAESVMSIYTGNEAYAVDCEQSLYVYETTIEGNWANYVITGTNLYKYSPEGEQVYEYFIPWEDGKGRIEGFAADEECNLILLTEDGIRVLDRNGNLKGTISTAAYKSGNGIHEELFGDEVGNVYYAFYNNSSMWRVMEVRDGFRLEEINSLELSQTREIEAAGEGNLFALDRLGGRLYEYDSGTMSVEVVLYFTDSDLSTTDVQQFLRLSPDELLVKGSSRMHRLIKTPASEVPQRNEIVIAALSPSTYLMKAVVEFNKQDNGFYVRIEQYGGGDGAAVRLDAALTSSQPPDLLDLSDLSIYKYATQGVMTDLSPYLEQSSVISEEDYLDNLIEGFTIDGRLVCIPAKMYVDYYLIRRSQMEELGGWSMKNVMELTEQFPEARLIHRTGHWGILKYFWLPYIMERFLDWEDWECSFESEEFREQLSWMKGCLEVSPVEYLEDGDLTWRFESVPLEDGLLMESSFYTFRELAINTVYMNGEGVIVGRPTEDGKGSFLCPVWDALGIVENSDRKGDAWKFLEYYLLSQREPSDDFVYITTCKELLYREAEEAVVPDYNYDEDGNIILDRYGNPSVNTHVWKYWEGETYQFDTAPQELVDQVLEGITSYDFTPIPYEDEIEAIILEEAEGCFYGNKSAEETARVIQRRVSLLLNERK